MCVAIAAKFQIEHFQRDHAERVNVHGATAQESRVAAAYRRRRDRLECVLQLGRYEMQISRPFAHVYACFYVCVHYIRRYAADFYQPIVLNEYRIARQITMHYRRITIMQITIKQKTEKNFNFPLYSKT